MGFSIVRQTIAIILMFFCGYSSAAEHSILTLKLGDKVINLSYEDMLEFTHVEHTMSNKWIEKTTTYTGVKLSGILEKYKITNEWLRMTALDDYSIELPIVDADKGAFIAYLIEGKQIEIRDKGPLWLLYPVNENRALDIDIYNNRSIWQLKAIEGLK
jgi:hypothetical protein